MARTKIQMQRRQMRIKFRHHICYAQHFAQTNSERRQASEVELFVKKKTFKAVESCYRKKVHFGYLTGF